MGRDDIWNPVFGDGRSENVAVLALRSDAGPGAAVLNRPGIARNERELGGGGHALKR